ncbi:MAG: 1-deoxy-D-xylulose-5-phosphate synthase [Deltaproteobacteria bacterium]|jgi:deoxyxylulose-5-phosphate synthase|nr:1-deoxy-D-xylulose-5-phosphate synthase [Deltaproteobacteria bacterium]
MPAPGPSLLERIASHPGDLRGLDTAALEELASDVRREIVRTVDRTGGHLASSLGAVELIVALHRIFDPYVDRIIFDVGHQAYAHKILCPREPGFVTLRQQGGISGFPRMAESRADAFGTGHSSTSISAALGLALARDLKGGAERCIAVIGDGALTGGMAMEALNHAGGLQTDLLVVFNDNRMSISPNVGAISQYLSLKLTSPEHVLLREKVKSTLNRIMPQRGKRVIRRLQEAEESIKGFLVSPRNFIAAWGFKYIGPIDGHSLEKLVPALAHVKLLRRPVFLHVLTTKGKGHAPAEDDPLSFHGWGGRKAPDKVQDRAGQAAQALTDPDRPAVAGAPEKAALPAAAEKPAAAEDALPPETPETAAVSGPGAPGKPSDLPGTDSGEALEPTIGFEPGTGTDSGPAADPGSGECGKPFRAPAPVAGDAAAMAPAPASPAEAARRTAAPVAPSPADARTYTEAFGRYMTARGREDGRLCAVTAAMSQGTGLADFFREFPERSFDVGIAEQHAVTLSAGLAAGGMRPVCAVYSTFLQRAYDQLYHDVALQGLPVVFAVDRAGLVGEDGATHHGSLDLSCLRLLPGMTVMAPRDGRELADMFELALALPGPSAVRYPRGACPPRRAAAAAPGPPSGLPSRPSGPPLEPGRAELMREGADLTIVAAGYCAWIALDAALALAEDGISAGVINARFIKPLDEELILSEARRTGRLLTVEENVIAGGLGGAVAELLMLRRAGQVAASSLGLPDTPVPHGPQSRQRAASGLDAAGIRLAAMELMKGA